MSLSSPPYSFQLLGKYNPFLPVIVTSNAVNLLHALGKQPSKEHASDEQLQ